MKYLSVKLQYIFWPFFLISSISIVGLTGLIWLFRRAMDYTPNGKILFLMILVFSIIIIFMSIMPRLMTIKRKNDSIGYLVAILTIAIPTFYAQEELQISGNGFVKAFLIMVAGQFVFLLLILDTRLTQNEVDKLRQRTLLSNPDYFKYFGYLGNIIMIFPFVFINILVYIFIYVSVPDIDSLTKSELLSWGVNYKPLTTNGEWWRLVTSVFIHKDFLHMFFNNYGLLVVSLLIYKYIRRIQYIFIYIVSGVISSAVSMILDGTCISFGSTGSIFGLFGVMFTACLAKAFPFDDFKSLIIMSSFFLISNIFFSFEGNYLIANAGGFITGGVIGIFLIRQIRKSIEFERQLLSGIKNN